MANISQQVSRPSGHAPSAGLERPFQGGRVQSQQVGRCGGRREQRHGEPGPLRGAPVCLRIVRQRQHGVGPGQIGLLEPLVPGMVLPRGVIETPIAPLGVDRRYAQRHSAQLRPQVDAQTCRSGQAPQAEREGSNDRSNVPGPYILSPNTASGVRANIGSDDGCAPVVGMYDLPQGETCSPGRTLRSGIYPSREA